MTATVRLPKAIIEDVMLCRPDLVGCQLYEIWYRDRSGLDVVLAYSRALVAPEIGEELVRASAPHGGMTLGWGPCLEDARVGYDEAGLPAAWGKPPPPAIGMTAAQKRMFGIVD